MKTIQYASLLLAAAIASSLSGCGSDAKSAQAAATEAAEKPKVEVLTVETSAVVLGDITASYAGTATLEAEREAKVVSEVGGVVLALSVEEGQSVRKGQVLARLDAERAQVVLRQAEAEMQRIVHNDARNEQLFERKLIARNAYEQNKSDLATHKAEVELARLTLSKSAVIAPFDGVITRRFIKQGQLLKANEVAFEMADFRDLKARLRVPERASVALRAGQAVDFHADAMPGKTYLAEVARVSPVVDAKSGTVEILIKVDNSSNDLRPGLFSRLDVAYDHVAAAILLPKSALLSGERDSNVYVVDGGKARRVAVKLGYEAGNNVQVLSGVSPGAEVVIAGQRALSEGSPVEPIKSQVAVAAASPKA
ncbi:MAG: efflux RND transporter periplasmic adaptor subunit [Tahibacter sp.]